MTKGIAIELKSSRGSFRSIAIELKIDGQRALSKTVYTMLQYKRGLGIYACKAQQVSA